MTILLPTQAHFSQWLIDLTRSYPTLTVPIPLKNENWITAAMRLVQLNNQVIATVVLPSLTLFPLPDDWRRWAYMFIQSI